MWTDDPTWAELVSGDHETAVDLDAWYDGVAVAPDLAVSELSWSSSFDGSAVRSQLDVTVVDFADGVPLCDESETCPLGTYGQLLIGHVVARLPSAGLEMAVPLGTYRIDASDADRHWSWHPVGRLYPTGGTVQVQALDCLADLRDAEFAGPTAPAGTVQEAMTALCRGYVGVDVSNLPATAVPASVTYGDSKWDAMIALARTANLVPVPGRDGVLRFVSTAVKPVADWSAVVTDGSLIRSRVTHDRQGLVNAVLATGEDGADGVSPIRALAQEQTGPLRADGPMKLQLRRHSSPFYRSYAQALSGANSILDASIRDRTVQVEFETIWDPARDVLDTAALTIDPTKPPVLGLVTSLKADAVAASMTGTASVPRSAL